MAKSIPMRQCVGCGEMKTKNSLIRVLKTEDGICVDSTGKKNGRGAYLCPNSECLALALKNKGLERSLKTSIPDDLKTTLKEEMSKIETK